MKHLGLSLPCKWCKQLLFGIPQEILLENEMPECIYVTWAAEGHRQFAVVGCLIFLHGRQSSFRQLSDNEDNLRLSVGSRR